MTVLSWMKVQPTDHSHDSCGPQLPAGFEQSLQRLGLVSSWLNRTLCQLEAPLQLETRQRRKETRTTMQTLQEARQELAEKEKAAASCAFLHLPGEAPNAQSALARLP